MSPPGPAGAEWAVALVAWAAATALVGDGVRWLGARWVPWWRTRDPIERALLAFYLGGAAVFLIAAVSVGAFALPVLLAAVALGAVLAGVRLRRGSAVRDLGAMAVGLRRPAALVAVGSAVALFAFELAVALPVATGNTFDSSVLTLFTAILRHGGSLPISLVPYSSGGILYPQGATAWFGWAELLFGLPPARTSLLVTPLFFALAPLSGYVLGRRLLGTEAAGAAFALALAALGPGSRALVGGSNDLVLSVPLVLLLAAQLPTWMARAPLAWGDAAGFGLLAGYSAAINPTGAEWLLPTVLLVGLAVSDAGVRARLATLARWAAAVAAALVGIVPNLYVLYLGRSVPGLPPGAGAPPGGTSNALAASAFVPHVDPFLLGAGDVALSSVPALRLELIVLLVAGALLLIVRRPKVEAGFRGLVLVGGWVLVGLLALLVAAGGGDRVLAAVANLTNADELTFWLFLLYGLVAAVPLAYVLSRASEAFSETSVPVAEPARAARRSTTKWLAPALVAAALVAPGLILTPVQLAPQLRSTYDDFSSVSAADFALLAYAGAHLPAGARVLVAPGSVAEFLPGYAGAVVVLYPMTTGWPWANASYLAVVSDLTNGTMPPAGLADLNALAVGYLMVTQRNTVLWPAFSPAPLLNASGTFPIAWHEDDAYLFAYTPSG